MLGASTHSLEHSENQTAFDDGSGPWVSETAGAEALMADGTDETDWRSPDLALTVAP